MTNNAERREAAILNAELRNFTRLSEVLAPEKVLELANDFFSLCGMAITANAGKVLSCRTTCWSRRSPPASARNTPAAR